MTPQEQVQALNTAFGKWAYTDPQSYLAKSPEEQQKYTDDLMGLMGYFIQESQTKNKGGWMKSNLGFDLTDAAIGIATMGMVSPTVSAPLREGDYMGAAMAQAKGLALVAGIANAAPLIEGVLSSAGWANPGALSAMGELGGEPITMLEVLQEGGTATDLAQMGFSPDQITAGFDAVSMLNSPPVTAMLQSSLPSAAPAAPSLGAVVPTGAYNPASGYGGIANNVLSGPASMPSVNFGGSMLSLNEAVNAGATVKDLYELGFSQTDIMANIPQAANIGSGAVNAVTGNLGGIATGATGTAATGAASSLIPGVSNGQALGAATGVVGAVLGNQATNNAASQASAAMNQALNAQVGMYQQTRADFEPYRNMGTQGIQAYNDFISGKTTVQDTPAYQWDKAEIDRNMNRQLAARGRLNSTYAMDSLSRAYGAAAGAEYDKQYGRLLDPIKIGSNAAQMTGSAGNTLSNAYGQTGQNQAQNATSLGQNNASFLVGLGSLPMSLYNTYQTQNQNQQYLDWLKTQ